MFIIHGLKQIRRVFNMEYSQIRSVYTYEGKEVLIPGVARGLGHLFAETLLKKGVKAVVLSDMDVKQAKETTRKLGDRAYFIKCDVSKKFELRELFEKAKEHINGMDLIINNAGMLDGDNEDRLIAVNANGIVYGTFEGMKMMGKHKGEKGGIIVNVGSILGLRRCAPCAVYCGTKHFVAGFRQFMETPFYYNLPGLKIIVICPGFTETPLLDFVKVPKEFDGLDEYSAQAASKQNVEKQINAENMVYDFHGKVALVTGGAGGIGFQYCKQLIQNGVKGVAVLDLNPVSGEKAAKELGPQAFYIKADVTSNTDFEEAFKKTIAKFGGLDIVINNAGILNDEKWELQISINSTSVTRGMLLAFKYMGKDKGGKGGIIINTASAVALFSAIPSLPVYTASKHFVVVMGRSMGCPFYYNLTGIKVFSICPTLTETPLFDVSKPLPGFEGIKEEFKEKMLDFERQKPEFVGECLIKIINNGENGSVWLIGNGTDMTKYEDSRPIL